jgi:hypothetical protein
MRVPVSGAARGQPSENAARALRMSATALNGSA